MLLDDINSNRHRVQSIFTRLNDSQDKNEILFILEQLVREELLPLEQFEQLSELEDMDLPAIALAIKDTKIGKGIKFLPRKLSDWKDNLQAWLEELVEMGKTEVDNKVAAVLEELLKT